MVSIAGYFYILRHTGCPAVHDNFDTPLFSGIAWDIRLIFGVFKVWMLRFNYMYKLLRLVSVWFRKYLGKLEQGQKLSFWRPSDCMPMRQNFCQKSISGALDGDESAKKQKNNGAIQIWIIICGLFCQFQAQNDICREWIKFSTGIWQKWRKVHFLNLCNLNQSAHSYLNTKPQNMYM